MRCTKCSFISFDDLSACAKCSTDLSRLSNELNGTCIETRQEFFLGSAIQAPGLDEDILSDSQPLPPIDHSNMNFDDTNTGNFSPISSLGSDTSGPGFDDSVGFTTEDDVDIELGDIMPLDLDQLDSGFSLSDAALGDTDMLSSSDVDIDLDHTSNLSDSSTDFNFDDDLSGIDINISSSSDKNPGDADTMQTSAFDYTLKGLPAERFKDADFELDSLGQLSDIDVNLDETVSLGVGPALNETQITSLTSGVGEFAPLELDESLVAELAGGSSPDASGEFSVGFSSDEDASGEFELDPALVAELVDEGNAAAPGKDNLATLDEVGDFPPLREDDDLELAGLDLADIDVSDLVDKSAGVDNHEREESDAVLPVELSLDHVAEGDDLELGVDTLVFDDDFEAYHESKGGGEDLPAIELVSDEDDDVPPDLPA